MTLRPFLSRVAPKGPRMVLYRAAASIAAAFLLATSWPFAGRAEARADQFADTTSPADVVWGANVAATLEAGHSFDRSGLHINGNVDLRAPLKVAGSFRCSSCVFTGSVNASDVEFEDVVDLDRSKVGGTVDLRGALFDRSVVWTNATIRQTASFNLAVFSQSTAFDGTIFRGPAVFSGARFERESSFADVDFQSTASFDGVAFIGDSAFTSGTSRAAPGSAAARCTNGTGVAFSGYASFARASFHGRADFRNRCFTANAYLSGVVLLGPADFRSAEFLAAANFSEASFGADASFKLVDFQGMANFQTVSAAQDLTFEAARFYTGAALNGATIGGILSFDLAPVLRQLSLDDVTVGGIKLDPHRIYVVVGHDTRQAILQKVENTARAAGDTATANDARFIRLQLAGDYRLSQAAGRGAWWDWIGTWVQDRLFYRYIAGYLVRPLNPLAVFGLLAVAGVVVRAGIRFPFLRKARRWLWAYVRSWLRRAKARGAAPSQPPSQEAAGAGLPATADNAGQPAETAGVLSSGAQAGTPGDDPEHPGASGPGNSGSSPLTAGADSQEQPERQPRLAAVILPLLESMYLTVKVAFLPRPTEETKTNTMRLKRARDYFVAFVRWMEYAGYKILTVLFITCVANANATLHQFIDTIIGSR